MTPTDTLLLAVAIFAYACSTLLLFYYLRFWRNNMPFAIRKKGARWQVVNKNTGRVLGTHDTKKKALAQLRAVKANTKD